MYLHLFVFIYNIFVVLKSKFSSLIVYALFIL